ncbi:hypothetical protein JNUCC1_00968 [Lentibacillus sp. JNUCC-1]|uniref:hypothetical protein n=1 Tax=Lentibacillus sp. JNUCC-1 TaxID=2654513 RepID=UPI0012E97CB6|nr:hypothetical protein [Lentibacillus sp. JNUCC-1]MUV37162.1 hypothetical protein [Lentibacillus sp. JNUCC-1]
MAEVAHFYGRDGSKTWQAWSYPVSFFTHLITGGDYLTLTDVRTSDTLPIRPQKNRLDAYLRPIAVSNHFIEFMNLVPFSGKLNMK